MCARIFLFLAVLLTAATTHAQVLQLPSFHSTGVDTTVIVPDRGTASLSGGRSGMSGDALFGGLPKNRGWGITRQSSGMSITAQIHDPDAADRAALGSMLRRPPNRDAAPRRGNVPSLRTSAGTAPSDAPLASVAEIERRRAAPEAAAQREATALFEKARQARAAGKNSVAAIYYRMAAKHAQGSLARDIESELRALSARR